jgi:hypothetical protein
MKLPRRSIDFDRYDRYMDDQFARLWAELKYLRARLAIYEPETTAEVGIGIEVQVRVTREVHLRASMAIGLTEAARPSRLRFVAAFAGIGIGLAVNVTTTLKKK